METAGHFDQVPVESSYGANNKEAEAQVSMQGTLHDFSDKDLAVIDSSIVSAYNEAFSKPGYSIGSFDAFTDVDVPLGCLPNCRMCHPDDDAMANNAKMVFARVMTHSKAGVSDTQDSQMAFMHEAFEKSFCTASSATAAVPTLPTCTIVAFPSFTTLSEPLRPPRSKQSSVGWSWNPSKR